MYHHSPTLADVCVGICRGRGLCQASSKRMKERGRERGREGEQAAGRRKEWGEGRAGGTVAVGILIGCAILIVLVIALRFLPVSAAAPKFHT